MAASIYSTGTNDSRISNLLDNFIECILLKFYCANMWYNTLYVKYSLNILLALCVLFLVVQLVPYFYPILEFILLFFSPLIIGIILYYVFRPFFIWLREHNVPFLLAIAIIFLVLAAVVSLVVTFLAPLIVIPIQQVAADPNQKLEEVKSATKSILDLFNLNNFSIEEIKSILLPYISKLQQAILQNTFSVLSTITKVAFVSVITPFCLFYLLKDDRKFHRWALDAVPEDYRTQVENILSHLDQTLVTFINGQMTIALTVTFIAFIGLLIIGINNLAFLTFFTFLLSLIPYLGTFLAIIPPILMGLGDSYLMALAAGIVMICVHLTEANIITPYVMMKRFDIHPLTVILLIVASFSLFGVLGPLWITPFYVFVREVISQAYDFVEKLRHKKTKQES